MASVARHCGQLMACPGGKRRAAGGAGHGRLPGRRRQQGMRLEGFARVEGARQAGHVEQARHRAAIRAQPVGRADGGAAVHATDAALGLQQALAVLGRHRPQQAFFLQELGERLVGAIALGALQLQRFAPARLVVHGLQRLRAARAGAARAKHLVRQGIGLGHAADQRQEAAAGETGAFGAVEPDQVAMAAEIEGDRLAVVAVGEQALHRLAAVAAGQQGLSGRGEGRRGGGHLRPSARRPACWRGCGRCRRCRRRRLGRPDPPCAGRRGRRDRCRRTGAGPWPR